MLTDLLEFPPPGGGSHVDRRPARRTATSHTGREILAQTRTRRPAGASEILPRFDPALIAGGRSVERATRAATVATA
jgi:hypothetical protein